MAHLQAADPSVRCAAPGGPTSSRGNHQVGAGSTDRRLRLLDGALLVGLVVVGTALRLPALPADGLFHDDAWVVATALHGGLRQLPEIGNAHPGFTALLWVLRPLIGDDPTAYALPTFLAGVLGAPALYLLLRLTGAARAVALAVSALLLVSELQLAYSGRVKPYTIDVLVVVGMALVVRHVAERRWNPKVATIWVAGTLAVSTLGAFPLLTAAVAGAVLVSHAVGDRVVRFAAVGAQALGSLALLLSTQRTYDVWFMRMAWRGRLDGFADGSGGPLTVAVDAATRIQRSSAVLVNGPAWLTGALAALAVVGLVSLTLRTTWGRFPLALLSAAVAGNLLGWVPFGSSTFDGLRVTLWIAPVLALGLAEAVRPAVGRLAPVGQAALVPAAAVTTGVLCFLAADDPPRYPWSGTASASAFVDRELGADDVVMPLFTARFAYATETTLPVRVTGDPSSVTGVAPHFLDPRVRPETPPRNARRATEAVADAVGDAERVLVFSGIAVPGSPDPLAAVASELTDLGFMLHVRHRFADAEVADWRR